MTQRQRAQREPHGFTLIELLVVIVILGIISGVVVFAVRGIGSKGNHEAVATDERIIRTAEEAFCARHGRYADEAELVEKKFLSDYSEYHDVFATDGKIEPPLGPCNGWRYSLDPTNGTGTGTGTNGGAPTVGRRRRAIRHRAIRRPHADRRKGGASSRGRSGSCTTEPAPTTP